ncbi:MAG: ATP-dependent endonuclease, partial [Chryseobacterium sp.]|nr:ATP-dependent endonuclease [Chryseobacterium sp.]
EIKNFRLLKDVKISLEEYNTVIVGRNNSGKTSLTEVFRRVFSHKTGFSIHDFSIQCLDKFKNALNAKLSGKDDEEIRATIPTIEIKITIEYPTDAPDLGALSDFVIDLNTASNVAVIVIQYTLKDGKIDYLFEGITDESESNVKAFMKSLKEKINTLFEVRIFAQDPNDLNNILRMDHIKLRSVIGVGFINAQRGLDDETQSEKDVLGKVLSQLFNASKSETAPLDMKEKSDALKAIVGDIQTTVDTDFNEQLNELLPALALFGYPSIVDSKLTTETTINVENILSSHTKIRYEHAEHVFLPETYNGLGTRNLIYMLFQLYEFFREYQSRPATNSLDIIFIEEPEAHLHPQMQQVFIAKLYEIVKQFSETYNRGTIWPVQFVVTTHSTHIANEAPFEAIRYFLTSTSPCRQTTVKDLRQEFSDPGLIADKEFLHKYLTLTKCDLYFADKAVLIEGTAERLLMPLLIKKSDELNNTTLGLQYLSVIEVGGAYAHHFYKFLDFLNLRCLVITDLDSVLQTQGETRIIYPASLVSLGSHTSNAGIKNWFAAGTTGHYSLTDCIGKTEQEKIIGSRRIAYQISEDGLLGTGRSLEEALFLANRVKFGIQEGTVQEIEQAAKDEAPSDKQKANFALYHAIDNTEWTPPKYILEGLQWLAQNSSLILAAVPETEESTNETIDQVIPTIETPESSNTNETILD